MIETSPLEGGTALCRIPQDILSAPARDVIGQAARSWLDRRRLTPLELTHHSAHGRLLADDGTHYANMVQRVAVTQIRGTRQSVGERVKELYDLIDQAQASIAAIERDLPPDLAQPDTEALSAHCVAGRYSIAAVTLSGWLAPLTDWHAKADLCFDLLSRETAPLLDAWLAEALHADALMPVMFGWVPNMGGRLEQIAHLLANLPLPVFAAPEGEPAPPCRGLQDRVAAAVAEHDLARFRAALADRFAQLLAANGHLADGEGMAELGCLRSLRKAMASLPSLATDEAVRAGFNRRYARLATPEAIIALFEPSPGWGLRVAEAFRFHEELEEPVSRANTMKYISYAFDHRDFMRDFAPVGTDRAKLATALRNLLHRSSITPHRKEVFARALAGLGATMDAAAEAERRRMTRSIAGPEDKVTLNGRAYILRNWSPVGLVFGPVAHPPAAEQACQLQVRVRNPVLAVTFEAEATVLRVDEEGIVAVRYRCKERLAERKIKDYFGQ